METNDSIVSCPPCRSPAICIKSGCAMAAEKNAALADRLVEKPDLLTALSRIPRR
jgi:hypothetical protein